MKRRAIIVAATFVALAAVALGGFAVGRQQATPSYVTAPVTRADVVKALTADGTLSAKTRYGLAFGSLPIVLTASGDSATAGQTKASWPVTQVNAEVGQAVVKGAVLAVADTSQLRAQIAQTTNDLQLARTHATQDEAKLKGTTDPVKVQKLQAALAAARAAAASATSLLAILQAQVVHPSLIAPADGIVEAVNIEAGADAPRGDAVIVDVGGLLASTEVGENDLATLHAGLAVTVTIEALKERVPGTIASIAVAPLRASAAHPTYPLTVALATTPAAARIGMTVQVSAVEEVAKGVLAVPVASVNGQAGDYHVLVLTADGNARQQSVSIGLIGDTLVQIAHGLALGDQVVIGFPGMQSSASPSLTPQPSATPASSASPSGSAKSSSHPHRSPKPSPTSTTSPTPSPGKT